MADCFDYFSESGVVHGFLAHDGDVFAGAVVVDVVEAVRVGEAGLEHAEVFGLIVHVADELDVVETDTFVVFSKVNTSYF